MVDIQNQIVIDKPLELVSEYAANPAHAPAWYKNVRVANWKAEKQLQIGSKINFIANFLGAELSYTYEIIEYIPNQKMVMTTSEGLFHMETIYRWTALKDNRTQMLVRNTGRSTGFTKLLNPLLSYFISKSNSQDLREIKRILEQQK